MTETPVRRTPRGFVVYAEGVDHNGESWSVQQSSLATEDCVWIGRNTAGGEPSRDHLGVTQGREVRDALTTWLADVDPDPTPDETSRSKAARRSRRIRGHAASLRGALDAPDATPFKDLLALVVRARAAQAVLADREAELLARLGPCRAQPCRLHHAHRGPCDDRPGRDSP